MIIVKLWPGKSEQPKARLAEGIIKDIMDGLDYGEGSVSVDIEGVEPRDWSTRAQICSGDGTLFAAIPPSGALS
jgi:phenylpyruvate tautomerase PptA (4-oxalocrotonate tautomerase family)